jgi:hypothetical protein
MSLPRYSLKTLFSTTTFFCVFAACLYFPGNQFERLMYASLVAMVSAALFILAVRDQITGKHRLSHEPWYIWTSPTALFICGVWSLGVMVWVFMHLGPYR